MSSAPPIPAPELLRWHEVARALGDVSKSEFFDWDAKGAIPEPVKIDGTRLWRRLELRDWCAAGCPHRDEWKWRPALPARLDDLIRVRTEQLGELQAEVRELEARRDAGERLVHVRR